MLGFKGPRKMTVILPGMTADHQRVEFKLSAESDSLIGEWQVLAVCLCVDWLLLGESQVNVKYMVQHQAIKQCLCIDEVVLSHISPD